MRYDLSDLDELIDVTPPINEHRDYGPAGIDLPQVPQFKDRQPMSELTFADLIERLRQGDEAAVQILVDDYSDAIRREVRFSLLDSRIRRMVTESDICQSVFTRFCLGLWAGTYQVEQPEQLVGLLKTMVRAKVVDWTRHAKAQRRDVRRSVPMDTQVGQVQAARDRTPSQIVSDGEVLDRLRQNLSERELKILELRQQQYQWPQIADMLGGETKPEALRKQYERAMSRAIEAIGLQDV